jgi:predicted homoserine dehydrogenase-like protein
MLIHELIRLEEEKTPIRIGVSGAGWMGSGFVTQVEQMKGMTVNLIADEDTTSVRKVFESVGCGAEDIVSAENRGQAEDALRRGKRVITGSYALASQLDQVDIVVDVTPSPAIGAETAYACIQNGKDVVLVNIEADVTIGRILKHLAQKAGVLYTVSSGDEPGCIMELYDFVTALGYEPIVAGKGKNNPLNRSANPDTVAESARKADKDQWQVASYVDGTKTMFEMTCAANATGFVPMQRGMKGPEADLSTVSEIFALEEDGGITPHPGVVDFVQGSAMAGGVFITVRVDNQRINDDLVYLKVGKGRYFTFFRPYHLWFLEAPISVARAFLHKQTTLVPKDEPVAEVMTIAKKDLRAGDRLDNFGGYTFYGCNDKAEVAKEMYALPVGLAPGARIVADVSVDEVITYNHVELDESSTLVKLRRDQDRLDS